jgi:hypothetical protein
MLSVNSNSELGGRGVSLKLHPKKYKGMRRFGTDGMNNNIHLIRLSDNYRELRKFIIPI